MSKEPLRRIDAIGKRVLASVLGLLAGLVLGIIGGILLVGFGDPLLATIAAAAVGGAVAGWLWPTPFLFVAELLLGMFGVDV